MRAAYFIAAAAVAAGLYATRARASFPTADNSTGAEPPVNPAGQPEAIQTSADTPGPAFSWAGIHNFKPDEFRGSAFPGAPSRDLLALLDTRVIVAADKLRSRLGRPLIVSPVDGAIARTYGDTTSRHYAVGRLSDALDLFTPVASLDEVYQAAQEIPEIGGIGLYPHTSPHPLIHIDTRPRGFGGRIATWARDQDGNYVAIGYALNRSIG